MPTPRPANTHVKMLRGDQGDQAQPASNPSLPSTAKMSFTPAHKAAAVKVRASAPASLPWLSALPEDEEAGAWPCSEGGIEELCRAHLPGMEALSPHRQVSAGSLLLFGSFPCSDTCSAPREGHPSTCSAACAPPTPTSAPPYSPEGAWFLT